jgi:hypothetical protein
VSVEPILPTSRKFQDAPRVALGWFLERLAAREPFAFTRWGDGEWLAVLQGGENELGDKKGFLPGEQDFIPELCTAIRHTLLLRPSYMLGMQEYALQLYGAEIRRFVVQHSLEGLGWIRSDVLHKANIRGHLSNFATELQKAPLILLGPAHLKPVSDALDARAFIQVPSRNAYLELDRLHNDAVLALEEAPSPTFVSVSMGVAANILIHRLHEQFPGHMYCDMGSIWDVHVGVKSRAYMRKIEIPMIPALGFGHQ